MEQTQKASALSLEDLDERKVGRKRDEQMYKTLGAHASQLGLS